MNESDYKDLFYVVRILSKKIESIAPSSLIAIHNGKESGQEIPHVHVHIIPRDSSDDAGSVHSMFTKRPSVDDYEFENLQKTLQDSK